MEAQDSCSPSSSVSDESDICWICLDGVEKAPLRQVCGCPRRVHDACLARWQLHSAGRSEETQCRFCKQDLRDWRPVITQATGAKVVTPYMRVSFNGRTHKVQVKPGADGAKEFENQIRRLLQLPEDQEFDVIFHCRAPGTGDKLQLQGLCAFDAAVHCASLSSKPTASQQTAPNSKQQSKPGLLGKLINRFLGRTDEPTPAPAAAVAAAAAPAPTPPATTAAAASS